MACYYDHMSFVLHPHLPRQLHRSLEYCAAARQRSTAVIHCTAHGRSMLASPPLAVTGSRTPHHTSQPAARSAAPKTPARSREISRPVLLCPATAGYMAGSAEAKAASVAASGTQKHFDRGFGKKEKKGAVRARSGRDRGAV